VAKLTLWSTDRLAWQVITVPVQMSSLDSVRAEVGFGAGGVLLFGNSAPPDLARQLAHLASASPGGIGPMVMSDVEGGAIERAANLLGPLPSARSMAQTMSPSQIESYARTMGGRMRAIGLTMDLAPVMDLDAGPGPTVTDPDGTRSFSANPQIAAEDGAAFADGLSAAGVAPAAKHFPGLHGAGDNTDVGPAQTSPWSTLQASGLVPFRAAIARGVPAIMLSNASVPGLSSLPSTISPQVISALRVGLGFRGLILTDALTAGAIAKIGLGVPQAATASLIAGADMILYNGATADVTTNARETASAIDAAVANGSLPRAQLIASVGRVLAVKHVDLCSGS
jgi:beta-N-acetylhexosaminidase